ncbi:hypothetical protein QZH41_018808, partial [Actinostola sp. cb2023]
INLYRNERSFDISTSIVSASSVGFQFLKEPFGFHDVAFGENYTIDCSTNGTNVTTSLYHKQGIAWENLPKAGLESQLIIKGDVYTILDFGISNSGFYQCRAIDASGEKIQWPTGVGFLLPDISMVPEATIIPRYAVAEGQNQNITCESARGTTLTWFRTSGDSDVQVPNEKTVIIVDTKGNTAKNILIIKNAKKSDSGTYKCVVTFRGKQRYVMTAITVFGHCGFLQGINASYRPSKMTKFGGFKFLAPKPSNIFKGVAFGARLTMNCATNDPTATTSLYHKRSVTWENLSKSAPNLVKVGDVFTVPDIGLDNSGQYKCRATNANGSTIEWPSSVGLFVIPYKLNTPKVTVSPNYQVRLTVGQSINFTCNSTAGTKLQWFKEVAKNKQRPVQGYKTVRSSPSNCSNVLVLTIVNAEPADAGFYKCLMKYRGTERYKLASLKVYDDPLPKIISHSGQTGPVIVKNGTELEIQCIAEGHPKPIIKWYKDGKQIAVPGCVVARDLASCDGVKYTLKLASLTSTKVKSVLTIKKVSKRQDKGSYTCRAVNKFGQVSTDIMVYVPDFPAVFQFLEPKPKIPVKTVEFGARLTMNCATNDPTATTSLYHKGSGTWDNLSKSGSKLAKAGDIYTVRQFWLQNSGYYKCRATNANGSTIEWPSSVGLFVIPNIVRAPELTVSPNYQVSLIVGQSINFTCNSTAGTKLQWFKEVAKNKQRPVPGYKTVRNSNSKFNVLVLTIVNAEPADTGFYKCLMKYRGTERYRFTRLHVYGKHPPKIVSYSGQTGPVPVKNRAKLEIECIAEGHPKPIIKWYKDGKQIAVAGCVVARDFPPCDGARYTLKLASLTSMRVQSVLAIKGFNQNQNDAESYICRAVNKFGRAIVDVTVGVQGLVSLRFLNPAPTFRTQGFSTTLIVDCSTSNPNDVTTKLYLSINLVCFSKTLANHPKVRLQPNKSQTVKEGSSILFTCISEPYVKLKWFKVFTDKKSRAVPRHHLTRRRNLKELRLVLNFTNVASKDEGRYMCRMKYLDRTEEIFAELKTNKLRFLEEPERFTTLWLSSNLTINCTTNNPHATTAVYHRKYAVQRDSGWRRLSLVPGNFVQEGSVYTVVGVTIPDRGQYQCRAWSKEGVVIRWPNTHGIVIPISRIKLDLNITPTLSGPLKPNSNQNLTCSTSRLSARLQWFSMVSSARSYTRISSQSDRVRKVKSSSENKLILMLRDITMADEGVYKCVMKLHGKKNVRLAAVDVGFQPRTRFRKAAVVAKAGSHSFLWNHGIATTYSHVDQG